MHMYMYMYMGMCIYIYIYTYTHTCIVARSSSRAAAGPTNKATHSIISYCSRTYTRT